MATTPSIEWPDGRRVELRPQQVRPDLKPFVRSGVEYQLLGSSNLRSLEAWVNTQVNHATDPRLVPLAALQAMGVHPMVYLAERTITGVIRRPNLYYAHHPDKRVVKETEEWLWPVLPAILATAARAFAYGSVPLILNWGREDLKIEIPRDEGGTRGRTLKAHTHYVSAHELWPGDVTIRVENDRLRWIEHEGRIYRADRAAVLRWDAEFGSWTGQAARRRAWRDYCKSMIVDVLQARYLERSVDSPRVAWAPPGTQTVNGVEVPNSHYVNQLLLALRGGGAITLPSTRDANGNKRYELEVLDLPDRESVWERALNRFDGGILKSYLVPPKLGGLEEIAAAGARTLDGMLREFIQDLAQFAADVLTELVGFVHTANHNPTKVPPPEILVYEVPAAVRKLYLEVLRLVTAANRRESPADWVDVPALLDQLGVPLRTTPLEPEGGDGQSGRPLDTTSEREERRESTREPDVSSKR